MPDHLIDTPIKLATCNRCGAYVYLAHSSGIRAAADVAVAGRDAYIAALMGGRRLFDLVEAAGRPQKLLHRSHVSPVPAFDAAGLQEVANGRRKVLAEHGCGAHAMDAVKFTEVEQGPPSVPAMPGERRDGRHQPAALESGVPTSSPAGPATHPRSDLPPEAQAAWEAINGSVPQTTLLKPSRAERAAARGHRRTARPRQITERPPRCDVCNAYIGSDEVYVGVQLGSTWVWAIHDPECP
ncbi:hypothetical protein [Streptomyces hydrogenans]|uniref:Uncharacterized protein n=1 Tax=Streptomyces hydrogenans TaxID=1873719 RepID=A0ABQ3PJL2_9ACTN|nr:hypothetical protein [Streptomyces hydrogenans]GHG09994.1 hypothetical protein GCM10018784_23320 [Streptomyces hydrogenans]GHI25216.1 hypothetical protein Shyd_65870 [Streptomyces hydrogenans]